MVRLFIFKSARWGQLLRIIDKGVRRPQQVVVHVFCVVYSKSCNLKKTIAQTLLNGRHCLQFVLVLLFFVDKLVKTARKHVANIHPNLVRIVHLPQDSMQNY